MTTASDIICNPLEGLTSVLAIRDLRQRVRQAVRNQPRSRWEERLLALDPLTVLRCMRVAHSPVYDLPGHLLTIPELSRVLGTTMVRRALNTPVFDIADSESFRHLWLHAVTTACAARSLAAMSGEYDPERAYVLGLLHDLPAWLHHLSLHRCNEPSPIDPATWIRYWHLPDELAEVVQQTSGSRGRDCDGTRPSTLIAAAELLAELADFWHPGDGDVEARGTLLSVVTKDDLVAAHNLRQTVQERLAEFGLLASVARQGTPGSADLDDESIFVIRDQGNVADLVLSLMSCNESAQYRGIITATAAASLRYLRFERAYTVRWTPAANRCHIRAKADLSPRPLERMAVQPTEHEAALFEMARSTGEAQRVTNAGTTHEGLLRVLGADEALIAPLNRDFHTPTFVVMDRALSGSPIGLETERPGARALASCATLLTENLLLKKQRERAQKYALTDPLTRLYNRGVGINRLGQELSRAQRNDAPLTVLMLDMDDFKTLNDTRGHLAGDHALRHTANVLRKTLRKTDVVCRYGGEEFLIILPETDLAEASVSAARIYTAVAEAGRAIDLPLTISIGLAAVRPAEDDVESALGRADRALYASKARGRNRFSIDIG